MTTNAEQQQRRQAKQGKYQKLFDHLCGLKSSEWRTTFNEIESIVGFKLPASARRYRPWWANQSGRDHSHALAWGAAGWETSEVNMEAGTLVLRRKAEVGARNPVLDMVWPVHSAGAWPESPSLSREDIYDDRM